MTITRAPSPTDEAPVLAAIDMGSNSFRMELARVTQGRYQRTMYRKETVRLGGGLDAQGNLSEAAMRRGLDCLKTFAEQLQGLDPHHVRAVATQTLREAKNQVAFLARAEKALQHPIEVISGREEARLTYTGVAHLQPGDKPRLVIDIGGRSTEMILGKGLTPKVAESFAVGSVGLSMRYFGSGRLTAQAFRAAQVAAGAELEEALSVFAPTQWREALGSSGTVSAVSQWLVAAGMSHGTITPEHLRWCIEQCIAAGHVDQLNLPGLRDDRRPVVAGGLALLYTLCMQFGIKSLEPSKGALRQGVILELNQRLLTESRDVAAAKRQGDKQPGHRKGHAAALGEAASGDMRDRSVRDMQHRFAVDVKQAQRVRDAALGLHEQLMRGLSSKTQALQSTLREHHRELAWAAALHELGQMVSHHDHHRHSAYLLTHADAAGFSQNEQRRLADFVLGQRGGLRKVNTLLTQGSGMASSTWPLLCLRLAVILCHARTAAPWATMRLSVLRQHATLHVTERWARLHPRTMHLLHEESLAWQRGSSYRLTIVA
jgi:exopolyphosphatase / guanosine-5'-triphosphate,3'-diphosphate pyrophosphatase